MRLQTAALSLGTGTPGAGPDAHKNLRVIFHALSEMYLYIVINVHCDKYSLYRNDWKMSGGGGCVVGEATPDVLVLADLSPGAPGCVLGKQQRTALLHGPLHPWGSLRRDPGRLILEQPRYCHSAVRRVSR